MGRSILTFDKAVANAAELAYLTGMLAFLPACADPANEAAAAAPADVVVRATEVESVFEVTWSTASPGDARVTCDDSVVPPKEVLGETTTDGLDHTVLLAGLGEGTKWSCVATSGLWQSEPFDVDVAAAPTVVPQLTAAVPNAGDLSGFAVITHPIPGVSSVALVDREGRHTWWYVGEQDDLFSQAWVAADGRSIWFLSMGSSPRIHHMSFDGREHVVYEVPDAHHDFVLGEDGGFVVVRADTRTVKVGRQSRAVEGDSLAAYDGDGAFVRTIWSAWDTIPAEPEDFFEEEGGYGWTHANAISRADDNTWLVSLWGLDTVVRVRDEDGTQVWSVGAKSDFVYTDEGVPFSRQHGVSLDGDRLTVFNNRFNGGGDPADLWSEAVEFRLDRTAGTYARSWVYDADQLVFSAVLGEVDRLSDGDRFIGWGTAGRITELRGDTDVVWQVDADLDGALGYVHPVPLLAGATR